MGHGRNGLIRSDAPRVRELYESELDLIKHFKILDTNRPLRKIITNNGVFVADMRLRMSGPEIKPKGWITFFRPPLELDGDPHGSRCFLAILGIDTLI